MPALSRTSTTEMEVTSIRLERELKHQLKQLSGNQGYQALIRDVLWHYVQQKSEASALNIDRSEIRVTLPATAQQEERCVLTGEIIPMHESMLLGLTTGGDFVPLKHDSFLV